MTHRFETNRNRDQTIFKACFWYQESTRKTAGNIKCREFVAAYRFDPEERTLKLARIKDDPNKRRDDQTLKNDSPFAAVVFAVRHSCNPV